MTDQPVTIDAAAVLAVLQETHPDAVRAAVWQVRATQAEKALAELQAQDAHTEDV